MCGYFIIFYIIKKVSLLSLVFKDQTYCYPCACPSVCDMFSLLCSKAFLLITASEPFCYGVSMGFQPLHPFGGGCWGGQFMKLLRPIFVLFCFLSKFLAILFLNLLSVLKESRTSRFSSVRNVAVSQAEER